MTREEALKEGQLLGKICTIVYNEYYLPNCKGEPIKKIGFLLSEEFMNTVKDIPEDEMKNIRKRAEK